MNDMEHLKQKVVFLDKIIRGDDLAYPPKKGVSVLLYEHDVAINHPERGLLVRMNRQESFRRDVLIYAGIGSAIGATLITIAIKIFVP